MAEAWDYQGKIHNSNFQYLHGGYLSNVLGHFRYCYKLYIDEKQVHPNLKFYETEDQPMYVIPLFNATERLKALEKYFDEFKFTDFPRHIIFDEEFPKFSFPQSWIKQKTEVLETGKETIQLTYNYV